MSLDPTVSQPDLDLPDENQSFEDLEAQAQDDVDGNANLELALHYYHCTNQASKDLPKQQRLERVANYLTIAKNRPNQKAKKNLHLLFSKYPSLAAQNLLKLSIPNFDNEEIVLNETAIQDPYCFSSAEDSLTDNIERFSAILPLPPNNSTYLPFAESKAFQNPEEGRPGEAEYQWGVAQFSKSRYRESIPYFEAAARKNYIAAYLWLGLVYENDSLLAQEGFISGLNEVPNKEASKLYYQKVSENSKWLEDEAKTGEADAQHNLALCIYYGKIQNVAENAADYFQLAANQGYVFSEYMLGFCYEHGKGRAQDLRQAVQYFKLAADKGHRHAQKKMGLVYYKAVGVEKNFGEAVKYFKWAADQGDGEAQGWLGLCYFRGHGVGKNLQESLRYFTLAVQRRQGRYGLNMAVNDLGVCYATGKGVTKDLVKAQQLFEAASTKIVFANALKVASKNLSHVNTDLALHYQIESTKHLMQAASAGNSFAIKKLHTLLTNSPEIAAAVLISQLTLTETKPPVNPYLPESTYRTSPRPITELGDSPRNRAENEMASLIPDLENPFPPPIFSPNQSQRNNPNNSVEITKSNSSASNTGNNFHS